MTSRAGKWALSAVAVLAVAGVVAVVLALRPWDGEETAGGQESTPSGTGNSGPTAGTAAAVATVLAVGDIGRCDEEVDEATAAVVARFPDAPLLATGDLAYDEGSTSDFQRCYDPSYGRFAERTHPVPGNHEYHTEGAGPYFDYFGPAAGESGKGWYSFDVGEWHVVALNTNCREVGCDPGSEQERWLRADLEASDAACTLAFSHHPRFSSGVEHGGSRSVDPLWEALVDHGVELLLSGHEHNYERTAPLGPDGDVDEAGVRQFVVGTGGGNFYPLGSAIPGSEVGLVDTAGVLRLTLAPDGYDWAFLPVDDDVPVDEGSDSCR